MALESPNTLQSILDRLLSIFGGVVGNSIRLNESVAALQSIERMKSVENLAELSLDDGSYRNLFHLLAVCLNEARVLRSNHLAEAFNILANASRDPKWRYDLGKCDLYSQNAGWPLDPNHESYGYSHEEWSDYECGSILQVAVRTLHPRYAASLGQAGYHALRLISNCCADNDQNKRVVLESGGIDLLLRCADMRLWPEVVTVALWNICAESDNPVNAPIRPHVEEDSPSGQKFAAAEPNISTIACIQLTLRSTGECDDSNGPSTVADKIADAKRHTNIITELLDLSDVVKDESRKEMVVELLEKASWHLFPLSKESSTEERQSVIPKETRLIRPEAEPEQFLVKLLRGSGRTLALCYPRCNYDIRRTIALIMSNDDVKRKLINEDLVRAFLDVPNWENARMDDNELESHTSSREMSSLQQALFKTTYGLCGLPEFRERYAEDSKCSPLATECIDALAVISHPRPTTDALNTIPAASACVVLAGLTTTAEYALFLVQQKNVHLSLRPILRQHEDSATLFPALALLDRLAIAPENKTTIFRAGIIYDLPRFLIGFNVQPGIQREAVSVMRRIVLGHLEHVSGIGVCVPTGVAEDADGQYLGRSEEESGLLAALNLFRRTSDAEVKMEIGRLVVEVCRTLFQSTDGHPEEAGNAVRLAFDETNDMASPIAYIACNGKSPEVQGEGWFGLAILSTWQHGRPFILKCLANEEVQKQLEAVLQEREQASCQNISLMLTKLQLFPPDLVSASTRKFLDHAATVAGLPSVWPVLAPAV